MEMLNSPHVPARAARAAVDAVLLGFERFTAIFEKYFSLQSLVFSRIVSTNTHAFATSLGGGTVATVPFAGGGAVVAIEE